MVFSGRICRILMRMTQLSIQAHINTMKDVLRVISRMWTLITCVWLTGGVYMSALQIKNKKILFLWAIKN